MPEPKTAVDRADLQPLDLDTLRAHIAACLRNSVEQHACSVCGRPMEPEGAQHYSHCGLEYRQHSLAVIEALREALEASLAVVQVDDEGFITAEWNRAYCDARAALALVMGGT